MTHDPREAPQITMADIRKHAGEGMVSEQSVIDAANEVLKDIYTSPPPAEGWDEEYPFDDERFNKGVQHVVDLIARELGVTDWIAGDGSEDYDCDLWQTILNILSAKGLYDKDEGEFKAIRREAPAPRGVAPDPDRRELTEVERAHLQMALIESGTTIDEVLSRPDAGCGVRGEWFTLHQDGVVYRKELTGPNTARYVVVCSGCSIEDAEFIVKARTALSTPPAAAESNASVEARLREAVNDMLGAFAEGVCWSPEQRAAYEKAAKLVSPAGGDGPDSDCATHNEPTYPNGPCNYSGPCGWKDEANESRRDDLALAAKCAGKLCDDCPPVGYETDRTRCLPCPRRTVGDEAKKSDEAAGTRPVPSVSGNSDREQQRDTTGVTAGETATNQKSEGSPVQPDQGVASQHEYPDESRSGLNSSRNQSAPSDPTAERREIVARALMEKWPGDYAWGDGTREPNELAFETADAILAALDGGAGA